MSTGEIRSPVTVIVPPVVCHNLDPHTGIPFMPHMAAHLAGAIRAAGHPVQVIDCFGLQPNERQLDGEFMLMGSDERWVAEHVAPETRVCLIYCRTIAEFVAVERLIDCLREYRSDVSICLFENVQAVTSYSLRYIATDFVERGCAAIILGEPETRAAEVVQCLASGRRLDHVRGVVFSDGDEIVTTPDAPFESDLDSLPLPAWDLFPLDGYWQAGFAHAPTDGSRFLPMLTSRGCPYRCTFCIAPEVNPTWRGRSAQNVVDEMAHFHETMGIDDFHVSDLDPTISDARTQAIANDLIERELSITWKLAQGTKIETIKSAETLELMAKSGCRFVSFSPESGSPRLLKIMNKPFDHAHGLYLAGVMHDLGIRTQAVFLAGVPGEVEEDRKLSLNYARKLVRAGVDEVSLVIFTPLPGAALAQSMHGYEHYSQCTPSPSWRSDYRTLQWYRLRMYLTLFAYKAIWHPRKLFRELRAVFTGRFETKMEMSLFKQAKLYGLRYLPWLFRRLDAEKALAEL